MREERQDAVPWLMLVVKRCAWQIARRGQRWTTDVEVLTVEPDYPGEGTRVLPDAGPGIEEIVERAEALERRIELLGELKSDERTALILIGLGASYEEIGRLRGWSRTKVNRCAAEGGRGCESSIARGGGRKDEAQPM